MDPAQSRIDAHLNAHDDWMETAYASRDRQLVDFANRLDYWMRTFDPRAWTAGPASTRNTR